MLLLYHSLFLDSSLFSGVTTTECSTLQLFDNYSPRHSSFETHLSANGVLEPIFALTLPSMTGDDLKQLRLANKRLSLFVEPYLFRSICFSTAEDNFRAWRRITDPGSPLRHQVEHVCIDSTTFIHKITKFDYCERLSQHLIENSCEVPSTSKLWSKNIHEQESVI
jgi:hypothetical protein